MLPSCGKRGRLPHQAALQSVQWRCGFLGCTTKSKHNLHEVSLEEGLQLPLGGRVCEVPDVESSSLSGAGQDCIILCSLVVGDRLVGEGGVAKSGSNVVDGVRKLLHDSRHDGEVWDGLTELKL